MKTSVAEIVRKLIKFISGENIDEMKTSAMEVVIQEMDKIHKKQ